MFWYLAYIISIFLLFKRFGIFFNAQEGEIKNNKSQLFNILVVVCLYILALLMIIYDKLQLTSIIQISMLLVGLFVGVLIVYISKLLHKNKTSI
jgi:hypothetical protein